MEVIIELSPETSRQFQAHDQSAPTVKQLTTTIDALNVIVKPQYRAEEDKTGNYFFVIETNNWDECQRIASVLDPLPAVKAAYCKPGAEPASLP
jgi:hypothetical protein